jgi:hypothetical protein
MAGRPTSPPLSSQPLSVEDAKARLRLAAARAEPTVMMEGAIRSNPWNGVGLMLVAGVLIGASPSLRRAVGSLVVTGLRGLTRG